MNSDENETEFRTKVAKLIEKYNLEGTGDEFEQLWTASGDERRSLRELAEMFNKRILRSAIDESEMTPLSADVDDVYLRLQGEKGTSADRTRIRRRLEREGIDVETLQSDFVSYQAIRSFLKDDRNAEYNPSRDPIERDRESIQQLRNRTMLVTETKLEGLVKNDEITLGSHEITVDINVFCEDCGRQFDAIEVLDREGCECKR
ncbi:hypothetical protein Htur_4415 (plasmid) [Haloterrigena turkmenica DSM 5511]|uniref:Uncharacterized protein n=1 Tax=Haloterrigena turkmenica (strain ATCC 51198 / DSM 5511 / JCM 9101 / NCIMB 13204 / VKM B-1734 / 4k) TaxID=543526 RepID=D2S1H9_HALTV|nr:rod-determining factor RdfA [Haloterrigena turkmenica]ADB63226.1 hypothetical protein Htur_4415 [Haloterrigena turkmenica DSM 5511]